MVADPDASDDGADPSTNGQPSSGRDAPTGSDSLLPELAQPIRLSEVRVRTPTLEDLANALAFSTRPGAQNGATRVEWDAAVAGPRGTPDHAARPKNGSNGSRRAGSATAPGPTARLPNSAPAAHHPIPPPLGAATPRNGTTPPPPSPPRSTTPPPPTPAATPGPPGPPGPPEPSSGPRGRGPRQPTITHDVAPHVRPPPFEPDDVLRPDGRLFRATPPRTEFEPSGRTVPLRRILKTLLRQRRRLLLSLTAIALGVGYLSGSLSLLQRVSTGLDAQVGAGSEVADLVVEGPVAFDSPLEQVRAQINDSLRLSLAKIPGVAAAEPRLEGNATILRRDGTPLVTAGLTERPLGVNWPIDQQLNPYTVATGRGPSAAGEVAIDTTSALEAGYNVGDQVSIVSSQSRRTFTLVGTVRLGATDLPAGSTLALFPLGVAREMLGQPNDNQSIALRLQPGTDLETARRQIQGFVGLAEVSDKATYEDHRRLALAKSFTLIRFLLIGFAALTLAVGCFTVANSMALLFDQRRRGFALLRLIGSTPRQISAAALVEAGIVGAAAAVVGVPFGFLVSWGIEKTLGVLGAAVPTSGPIITWWVIPVSIAIGLIVTVAVSVTPARQAARTSALGAVTGSVDGPETRRPLLRILVRAIVGLAVGAAAGWGANGDLPAAGVGAGVGLAVVLVAGLIPPVLQGAVGLVTRLAIGRSSAMRSLSAQRSRQAKTRVAATAAALMFAAFVVSGLAVLSASLVQSLDSQVSRSVTADLVVDSGTFTRGSLPVELLDTLGSDPQVQALSGFRYAQLSVGRSSVRSIGVTGSTVGQVLDLRPTQGQLQTLDPGSIAVSSEVADAEGLSLGSPVLVRFGPNGTQTLTVSAVYPSDVTFVGGAIVDRDVLARQVPASVDILALVRLASGGSADHVREVARRFGVATVLPPSEFIGNRANLLRGFVRVVEWMLLFSVLLATIGVANTLQLSVNERRRELGLLRAVGASRRQVLRLVLSEAVGLSTVGSLLGIALGVGGAYATQQALAKFGLSAFQAPPATLAFIALAAATLGLGASCVPALRASQVQPLEAIAAADGAESAGARRRRVTARTATSSPSLGSSARIRGLHRRRGGDKDGPHGPSEDEMASRCFNCGNEPGPGESCQVCGESQSAEPLGMFSTRPTFAAVRDGAGERPSTNGHGGTAPTVETSQFVGAAPSASSARTDTVPRSNLWSVGTEAVDDPAETLTSPAPQPHASPAADQRRADIVDAAIVDDEPEIVIPPSRPGPATAPPPPPRPAEPLWSTRDDAAGRRPSPDWSDPPPTQLRSPFGAAPGDPDVARTEAPTGPPPDDIEVTVPPSPFGTEDIEDRWASTTSAPITTGEFEVDSPVAPAQQIQQGYQPVGAAEAAAANAAAGLGPAAAVFPPQGYQPPYQQPAVVYPQQPQPVYVSPPVGAPAPAYVVPQHGAPVPPAAWNQAPYQPPAPAAPPPGTVPVPANGGAPIATPDVHGVAAAMSRLAPRSHQLGVIPVTIAGGLLGADEVAVSIVVGLNGGIPAAVVLTSGRVIIVTDRRWVPDVEVFYLRAGLAVQGRHLGDTASLSIGEGQRGVTVDDIADVAVAVEMATMVRSRCTTPTGF